MAEFIFLPLWKYPLLCFFKYELEELPKIFVSDTVDKHHFSWPQFPACVFAVYGEIAADVFKFDSSKLYLMFLMNFC